jgi:hypothetical protein
MLVKYTKTGRRILNRAQRRSLHLAGSFRRFFLHATLEVVIDDVPRAVDLKSLLGGVFDLGSALYQRIRACVAGLGVGMLTFDASLPAVVTVVHGMVIRATSIGSAIAVVHGMLAPRPHVRVTHASK